MIPVISSSGLSPKAETRQARWIAKYGDVAARVLADLGELSLERDYLPIKKRIAKAKEERLTAKFGAPLLQALLDKGTLARLGLSTSDYLTAVCELEKRLDQLTPRSFAHLRLAMTAEARVALLSSPEREVVRPLSLRQVCLEDRVGREAVRLLMDPEVRCRVGLLARDDAALSEVEEFLRSTTDRIDLEKKFCRHRNLRILQEIQEKYFPEDAYLFNQLITDYFPAYKEGLAVPDEKLLRAAYEMYSWRAEVKTWIPPLLDVGSLSSESRPMSPVIDLVLEGIFEVEKQLRNANHLARSKDAAECKIFYNTFSWLPEIVRKASKIRDTFRLSFDMGPLIERIFAIHQELSKNIPPEKKGHLMVERGLLIGECRMIILGCIEEGAVLERRVIEKLPTLEAATEQVIRLMDLKMAATQKRERAERVWNHAWFPWTKWAAREACRTAYSEESVAIENYNAAAQLAERSKHKIVLLSYLRFLESEDFSGMDREALEAMRTLQETPPFSVMCVQNQSGESRFILIEGELPAKGKEKKALQRAIRIACQRQDISATLQFSFKEDEWEQTSKGAIRVTYIQEEASQAVKRLQAIVKVRSLLEDIFTGELIDASRMQEIARFVDSVDAEDPIFLEARSLIRRICLDRA